MQGDSINDGARANTLSETDIKVAMAAGVEASAANSYVSFADFLEYLERHPNATASGAGKAAQLTALLDAAIIVDGIGAGRFYGKRASSEQRLAWPRNGAKIDGADIPSDEIPGALARAQCAAAVYILTGVLEIDRNIDPNAVIKRLKSGPDEIEYAIRSQDVIGVRERFNLIEDILAGLMRPTDWRSRSRGRRIIAINNIGSGILKINNINQFGDNFGETNQ